MWASYSRTETTWPLSSYRLCPGTVPQGSILCILTSFQATFFSSIGVNGTFWYGNCNRIRIDSSSPKNIQKTGPSTDFTCECETLYHCSEASPNCSVYCFRIPSLYTSNVPLPESGKSQSRNDSSNMSSVFNSCRVLPRSVIKVHFTIDLKHDSKAIATKCIPVYYVWASLTNLTAWKRKYVESP
jgi:hypothetical protein